MLRLHEAFAAALLLVAPACVMRDYELTDDLPGDDDSPDDSTDDTGGSDGTGTGGTGNDSGSGSAPGSGSGGSGGSGGGGGGSGGYPTNTAGCLLPEAGEASDGSYWAGTSGTAGGSNGADVQYLSNGIHLADSDGAPDPDGPAAYDEDPWATLNAVLHPEELGCVDLSAFSAIVATVTTTTELTLRVQLTIPATESTANGGTCDEETEECFNHYKIADVVVNGNADVTVELPLTELSWPQDPAPAFTQESVMNLAVGIRPGASAADGALPPYDVTLTTVTFVP